MKRSPSSSCSSSNSSTSCIGFDNHSIKPTKSKRSRTTRPRKKCHKTITDNNANNTNTASPSISNRRSSIYRGVTRHRWTGRFEAHLWDKSSWNNIQNKKGKQVYLGAYDNEEAAAHTYDLAALKYWGPETTLNFPIETYTNELQEMQKVTKEEYLASLRRRSSGFSRGVSKYRGVARHHHNGRWEARIGRVFGNKYLYLGTYNTQEEAAAAYDMAAIEYRGPNAVTNFDISHYIDRLKQKGIPLDHILQESVPNCPAESDEPEAEVEQASPPPENQQEQETTSNSQLQPAQQLPPCMDTTSSMIGMDPLGDHELTWDFCLDSGLATLSVPDLTFGNSCELPDLFDDAGFADNIDLIFDACSFETDISNATYMSDDNIMGCGTEEVLVGVPDNMEEESGKEMLLPSSSSSPSCSTITDVSCNYSG